jgi:hypothetical protein
MVVAALLGVPRLEKFDPGEVMSWVEAVFVLEAGSTVADEYGGGGTVISSALHQSDSFLCVLEETKMAFRQIEKDGKRARTPTKQPYSYHSFLPAI